MEVTKWLKPLGFRQSFALKRHLNTVTGGGNQDVTRRRPDQERARNSPGFW